jgi:hypothetical protein
MKIKSITIENISVFDPIQLEHQELRLLVEEAEKLRVGHKYPVV